jgi:hypothetical protein
MLRGHRPWWGWLAAAALVATTPAPRLAAQTPTPPKLLADLLDRSDWRLLDPTTDLVGDYTIKQLEELDRWPPWTELDFDRDGSPDIAAVVVRKGAGNRPEFTVVVVHAAAPARAILVVPFSPQRIFGVSEGIKDDTVMPLRCADCDANVWFRWNGHAYEPLLRVAGETMLIGSEPGERASLFEEPRPGAVRAAELPSCASAKVLEVGGEEGKRWYRVQVVAPALARGWVPQQFVMERVECEK